MKWLITNINEVNVFSVSSTRDMLNALAALGENENDGSYAETIDHELIIEYCKTKSFGTWYIVKYYGYLTGSVIIDAKDGCWEGYKGYIPPRIIDEIKSIIRNR